MILFLLVVVMPLAIGFFCLLYLNGNILSGKKKCPHCGHEH